MATRPPSRRRPPVAGEKARRRAFGGAAPVPRVEDGARVPVEPVTELPVEERTAERPGPPLRSAGARTVAALVVLAVLAAAALSAAVVAATQADRAADLDRARRQAVGAARQAAPVVLSYDHRRLDADFARAKGYLTGAFAAEYDETTREVVAATARQYKAVVRAEVVGASVARDDADSVDVLLFVDQTTTSTRVATPQTDLNRVRMTMVRRGDRWLVAAVAAL